MTAEIFKKRQPVWWYIATWFGSGLAPVASGTAGSLAALPFAFIIQICFGNFALLSASIIMFLIGWWASNQYLFHKGGQDPREIVVDEVAGQWLLLSVLFPTWQSYLFAFFVFRIFDVLKPWPVSLADRKVKGGLGVMLDDMLAAFYPILIYLILMIEGQALNVSYLLNPLLDFLGGSYVQ